MYNIVLYYLLNSPLGGGAKKNLIWPKENGVREDEEVLIALLMPRLIGQRVSAEGFAALTGRAPAPKLGATPTPPPAPAYVLEEITELPEIEAALDGGNDASSNRAVAVLFHAAWGRNSCAAKDAAALALAAWPTALLAPPRVIVVDMEVVCCEAPYYSLPTTSPPARSRPH